MAESKPNKLVIWRICDGRMGHDNQSLGLVNAIAQQSELDLHDIDTPLFIRAACNYMGGSFPAGSGKPRPDLIIGAGHQTHLSLLGARRAYGGKTVVIMRPTMPTDWFDFCLIPDHDKPTIKNNIIVTHGALNNILPSNDHDRGSGLILVGGPSKHYDWNTDNLVEQVSAIINKMPDVQWLVSDSPRTPDETRRRLQGLEQANARCISHREMERGWVTEQLNKAGFVWVTADSVSMIYESLTSGAITGLISVPSSRKDKITNIVNDLDRARMITRLEDWMAGRALTAPPSHFNEAQRCASELLSRLQG